MKALEEFTKQFPTVQRVPGVKLINVVRRPCELSFREIDDVLAEVEKETEGEVASMTLKRVRDQCEKVNLTSACFVKVPARYYDLELEERRRIIGAPKVECLCKSLILENTECTTSDCSDPRNSRFFCIIIQYVASLSSQKVFKFVRSLSPGGSRSEFHFRMADSETAFRLTGFEHNAISPIGMAAGITMPIILAKGIADLSIDWIWVGGGQIDLKLGFKVSEFIEKLKPFIADIYR